MSQAFGDGYYEAEDDLEGIWDDDELMKELEQYG